MLCNKPWILTLTELPRHVLQWATGIGLPCVVPLHTLTGEQRTANGFKIFLHDFPIAGDRDSLAGVLAWGAPEAEVFLQIMTGLTRPHGNGFRLYLVLQQRVYEFFLGMPLEKRPLDEVAPRHPLATTVLDCIGLDAETQAGISTLIGGTARNVVPIPLGTSDYLVTDLVQPFITQSRLILVVPWEDPLAVDRILTTILQQHLRAPQSVELVTVIGGEALACKLVIDDMRSPDYSAEAWEQLRDDMEATYIDY